MPVFTIKMFPKQHDLKILQIQAFYKEETSLKVIFFAVLDHKYQFKRQNTAYYLLPFKSGLILSLKRQKRKLFKLTLLFYCFAGFAITYCGHFELLDLVEYKFFVFYAKTIRVQIMALMLW